MARKSAKAKVSPRKSKPVPRLALPVRSREFLAERMPLPARKQAIQRLSAIIVESFVGHLSREESEMLSTPQGQKAFLELWPEIVDAFLHGSPAEKKKQPRKTTGQSRKKRVRKDR